MSYILYHVFNVKEAKIVLESLKMAENEGLDTTDLRITLDEFVENSAAYEEE